MRANVKFAMLLAGQAAAVTTAIETYDKATGDMVFYNTSTVFIRGKSF